VVGAPGAVVIQIPLPICYIAKLFGLAQSFEQFERPEVDEEKSFLFEAEQQYCLALIYLTATRYSFRPIKYTQTLCLDS
jgi:hypothetical protein